MSDAGWPQSVCSRRRPARSSAGNPAKNSRGRSLYRWHWHVAAAPRVPKTVCRSAQLASFAGRTEIAGSVADMPTILQVERAYRQVLTFIDDRALPVHLPSVTELNDKDHNSLVIDEAKNAIVANPVPPVRGVAQLLADVSRIGVPVDPLVHEPHQRASDRPVQLGKLLLGPSRPDDDVVQRPYVSMISSIETVFAPDAKCAAAASSAR